jgi:hypothetical protein
MMSMRPPQHGHGRASIGGSAASAFSRSVKGYVLDFAPGIMRPVRLRRAATDIYNVMSALNEGRDEVAPDMTASTDNNNT